MIGSPVLAGSAGSLCAGELNYRARGRVAEEMAFIVPS